MSKLDDIFSRIKVDPKDTPQPNNIKIDTSKHNQTYNSSLIVVSIILSTTLIAMTALCYTKESRKTEPIQSPIISKQQGDEISALANIVSGCENKHYFDIYNDVRRISKTLRYREMSQEKFHLVKEMLERRVCEPE